MAVLPELRKGETTPESGRTPNTPQVISTISDASREARPSDRKKPKCEEARSAARSARHTRKPKITSTAATPQKPHSSPIAGSTRSVLPAGIIAGSPQPGPEPQAPPVESAHSECAS